MALRAFAILCLALGVVPVANMMTDGAAVPWYAAAAAEWLVRGAALLAVATLLALLLRHRLDRAIDRARSALLAPSPRAFGIAAALTAAVAAAIVSQVSFAGQPFTSDEMAQQFHARILLSGRIAAVSDPNPEFFNTAPVFDRDGRWYSQYPIGGPALIALGLAAGAAWLVNPILLGVAVWFLYGFLRRAFDEPAARVATLLAVASPMVLIMGGSQMNHVPTVTLVAIALWALHRWDSRSGGARGRAAAIIGLALGGIALLRPLDALLVALPVGALQLWRARRDPDAWLSLAVQSAVAVVPLALLFWANAATTGSPLLFGYEALNGPEHALGFHRDPNGELHTPARGLAYASGYLMRLSLYLFEWPVPGMLVVAAGAWTLAGASRWDVLLVGLATAVLLGYGAYWFDGFFAGPRFLFTAVPAFVVLAARAPLAARRIRHPIARNALTLVIPLSVAAAWLGPAGVSSARERVALYGVQRTKLKTDVERQIARAGASHALVFVNEPWRGRLLARLRALGLTQFRAERVLNSVDACALQSALDAEAGSGDAATARAERAIARARTAGTARRVPDLPADQALALVPGSVPTATCLAEFQRDAQGTIPYALFLARQRIGSDGRVGGDVVFARDLGARNELLRERFGDRAWYRYRPAASLGDTTIALVPYAR